MVFPSPSASTSLVAMYDRPASAVVRHTAQGRHRDLECARISVVQVRPAAHASAPPTRNIVPPHRICRKPLRHRFLLHSFLSLITRKPSVFALRGLPRVLLPSSPTRHRCAWRHCAVVLTRRSRHRVGRCSMRQSYMSLNCGSSLCQSLDWLKVHRVRAGRSRQGATMLFESGLHQAPDVTPAWYPIARQD
ncbi:hypothetical protein FKP32DRAFT_1077153 [Trametes sanguinea]|nr:hypothetical protein FKP32DRAFT_1077153 [Trametes sanguinea]